MGCSKSLIAKTINKDKSTVGREIKRNSDARSGEYRHELAQKKEVENKLYKRPRKRHDYENPIFVMDKLLFNSEVAFVT